MIFFHFLEGTIEFLKVRYFRKILDDIIGKVLILLSACIWNYFVISVISLTFLFLENVHRSEHLHRQHGYLGHPPLLLHDALHPTGCDHQALVLWTQHGEDKQKNWFFTFPVLAAPHSRQSKNSSYRFKENWFILWTFQLCEINQKKTRSGSLVENRPLTN